MIDLHTHTDRSDGSASPAQLVDDAKAMGLQALGITDHDTLDGYDTAVPLAVQAGLELICGIELSTRPDPPPDGSRPPSVHLLGYFLQEPASPGFRQWIRGHQESRRERNRKRAAEQRCSEIHDALLNWFLCGFEVYLRSALRSPARFGFPAMAANGPEL